MNVSTVEHRGCRLSFEREGSGPPIIFIQGVGLHGRGWTPQVRELHRHYECLTFDNRGMGASQPIGTDITVAQMAEDTFSIMSHVGWESAHVVGHSLGGPVALTRSADSAGRVRQRPAQEPRCERRVATS